MNKDAILASVIGFGIGICITGILLVGPNVLKAMPKLPSLTFPQQNKTDNTTPANETNVAAPTPQTATFSIDSPITDTIQNKDDVLVSGNTPPGSIVFVQSDIDEQVATVTADGKYAATIALQEGDNALTVTSYGNGKPVSQSVVVYYTPDEF